MALKISDSELNMYADDSTVGATATDRAFLSVSINMINAHKTWSCWFNNAC